MTYRISQIAADLEKELDPIFEHLVERQYSLLGTKPRTNHAELEADAIALDLALAMLCQRMPQYTEEEETRSITATSKRELIEMISGYSFKVSVNRHKGYNLGIHTDKQTQVLHHEGLKLPAVVATICSLFYCETLADPNDDHGILSFKPS